MAPNRTIHLDGLTVRGLDGPAQTFATAAEAAGRAAIAREALSYEGTPFRNCADIRGRSGGIDCAMLCVRCYVDTGRLAPFDPRPYSAQWMLHRDEEKFLEWIEQKLGAVRTDAPHIGDVVVFRYGHCFSHGGILVGEKKMVHAYGAAGMTIISGIDEEPLRYMPALGGQVLRPRLFFNVWRDG